jgi:hypothetical protein
MTSVQLLQPIEVEHAGALTIYRFTAELPLLWTEGLTSELELADADIEQLLAHRRHARWEVELCLRGEHHLDLLGLLNRPRVESLRTRRHRVLGHHVARDEEGLLQLHLRGPDVPGFLAWTLLELRRMALFPLHVDARSVDGYAEDRLVLASLGGASPSRETEQILRVMLAGLRSPAPLSA